MDDQHLALWAKTDRNRPEAYHPLLFHMLDAANVARRLWGHVLSLKWTSPWAENWGLTPEEAETWIGFLAGLHDIGKASPPFQSKWPDALVRLRAEGLAFPLPMPRCPHGWVTAEALEDLLHQESGLSDKTAELLSEALGGHHGTFPTASERLQVNRLTAGDAPWRSARRDLFLQLASLVGVDPRAGGPAWSGQRESDAFLMIFSGLVSVADWIASNETWFPFDAEPDGYPARSRERAEKALLELRWAERSGLHEGRPFALLFPKCRPPRALQEIVIQTLDAVAEAQLLIIEAPMGEGKTEAALYAANCWMDRERQKGCYVALPTMATSNQMFGRVRDYLEGAYPGEVINYSLLHGSAALVEAFRDLRLTTIGGDEEAGGDTATVLVEEWFLKSKRGLLTPFAVGTVDQGLMAVLQTRHFFVRLFGLAHKTVILDEVHAYDAYMSTLMDRLLEWLSALGCRVVLLSATLPTARRRALVRAWNSSACPVEDAAYPRVTWVSPRGMGMIPFEASMRYEAHVETLPWEDLGSLANRLKDRLAEGGCAAIICNTVGRAQEVNEIVGQNFPNEELALFHARFPFEDRKRIEDQVLERFGLPVNNSRRPRRMVLVATQVVEQSLDLDFDLMVSDLAPVDLLLQRMGRLHRHSGRRRPAPLLQREMWVLGPESGMAPPLFHPGAEKIYGRHLLLRTWLALMGRKVIRIPEDLDPLIASVYDDLAPPSDLGEQLHEDWETSLHALMAKRRKMEAKAAQVRILPPGHPTPLWEDANLQLREDEPETHADLQALTRLSEAPSVPVVCLFGSEDSAFLDAGKTRLVALDRPPNPAQTEALLGRALTLTNFTLTPWLIKAGSCPPGWVRSPFLRHHRVLFFDGNPPATVLDGRYALVLDPTLGLSWRRMDG